MPRLKTMVLAAGALAAAPRLLRRLRAQPGPPRSNAPGAQPAPVPTEVTAEQPSGGDRLVAREEAAAAAAAGAVGGPGNPSSGDPAMDPVLEAGGGEAEGFEAAEAELIESASHGNGGRDPIADAFPPEEEAAGKAVYGEPDEADPADH